MALGLGDFYSISWQLRQDFPAFPGDLLVSLVVDEIDVKARKSSQARIRPLGESLYKQGRACRLEVRG